MQSRRGLTVSRLPVCHQPPQCRSVARRSKRRALWSVDTGKSGCNRSVASWRPVSGLRACMRCRLLLLLVCHRNLLLARIPAEWGRPLQLLIAPTLESLSWSARLRGVRQERARTLHCLRRHRWAVAARLVGCPSAIQGLLQLRGLEAEASHRGCGMLERASRPLSPSSSVLTLMVPFLQPAVPAPVLVFGRVVCELVSRPLPTRVPRRCLHRLRCEPLSMQHCVQSSAGRQRSFHRA